MNQWLTMVNVSPPTFFLELKRKNKWVKNHILQPKGRESLPLGKLLEHENRCRLTKER